MPAIKYGRRTGSPSRRQPLLRRDSSFAEKTHPLIPVKISPLQPTKVLDSILPAITGTTRTRGRYRLRDRSHVRRREADRNEPSTNPSRSGSEPAPDSFPEDFLRDIQGFV